MAKATVKIAFNEADIRAIIASPSGPGFQLVTRATRLVANQAKLNAPVDTGHLRASITQSVTVSGLHVTGRVGSPVSYALDVHEGTRPHVILPRNRKALRFTSRRGALVFALRVMHPGTSGRPFLRDALRRAAEFGFGVRSGSGQ